MGGLSVIRVSPWAGLVLLVVLLTGCAANPAQPGVYDPLEPINRKVLTFNEHVDHYVLEPLAQAWTFVTPGFVRQGISNFFSNLTYPGVVLNDILQGKTFRAAQDLLRFIVNSTLGLGGLFDPATALGLAEHNEDFGQTLAVWGSPPGPYLVLPLLGPSNLRDAIGLPADMYATAQTFIVSAIATRVALASLHAVNRRAQMAKAIRISYKASVDRYAFIRSAYHQRRRNAIYDGNPPLRNLYNESLFFNKEMLGESPFDGGPFGTESAEEAGNANQQ